MGHNHAHDVPAMGELLKDTPSNWGRWVFSAGSRGLAFF